MEQHGKGPVLEIYAQIGSCVCPVVIIRPLPGGVVGYTALPMSVLRPSKIFFSATIDGRNLIFGHKLHIGTPNRGKRF